MILKSVLKRLASGVRRIFMALLRPICSAIKARLSPIYIRVKRRRTIKKARCIVEQMLENEEKRSEKRNKNNEKHKGIRAE